MKQFDMFGSQISLRFQGKQIHKTRVGALATLIILAIIFGRLAQMIYERIIGLNPYILLSEIINPDHTPFIIRPNSFQFAIGLMNQDLQYVKDKQIFDIVGIQKTKQITHDQTSSETEFQLEDCTQDHFVQLDDQGYFLKLNYQQYYCLPKNIQLKIEGSANSNDYTEIMIALKRCEGGKCAEAPLIDGILNNHTIQVLFTNSVVSPENKENPFKKFVQDKQWENSQQLPKAHNIYLRNNVVKTDLGWFTENISTKMIPSFSYSESQVISKSKTFFEVKLSYEKQIENLYKRSYKSGFQIIAELGGYSSILIAIFLFLCSAYSQLTLSKAIIDEIFNFQEHNISEQLTEQYQKSRLSVSCQNYKILNTLEQKKTNHMTEIQEEIKKDEKQNYLAYDVINELQQNTGEQNTDRKDSANYSQSGQSDNEGQTNAQVTKIGFFIKKMKRLIKKSKNHYERFRANSNDVSMSINEKYRIKQSENEFKKLLGQTTNSMNFNMIQYLISFFCKCRRLNQKKRIIEFSIDRLYQHLDIQYILKKLIELDKLKRIILDDNQIQLLDYLPKPSINYYFTKENNLYIDNDKNDVFYHDTRSELEKVNNAIQSFQNIMTKQKQTEIDQKIVSFLDQRFQSLFQSTLKKKNELPKLSPDYSIFNVQYDEYHTAQQQSNQLSKTIENTFRTYQPIVPVKNPKF